MAAPTATANTSSSPPSPTPLPEARPSTSSSSSSSATTTTTAAAADPAPAPTAADLPLTMAASVILDQLPRSATQALETAGSVDREKVIIRLSPLPSTPSLSTPRFKCATHQRFEHVVRFLRRKLALREAEGVFCYVNCVFAPGLDEGVGNLWRCFRTGEELVVNYSVTPAFG